MKEITRFAFIILCLVAIETQICLASQKEPSFSKAFLGKIPQLLRDLSPRAYRTSAKKALEKYSKHYARWPFLGKSKLTETQQKTCKKIIEEHFVVSPFSRAGKLWSKINPLYAPPKIVFLPDILALYLGFTGRFSPGIILLKKSLSKPENKKRFESVFSHEAKHFKQWASFFVHARSCFLKEDETHFWIEYDASRSQEKRDRKKDPEKNLKPFEIPWGLNKKGSPYFFGKLDAYLSICKKQKIKPEVQLEKTLFRFLDPHTIEEKKIPALINSPRNWRARFDQHKKLILKEKKLKQEENFEVPIW